MSELGAASVREFGNERPNLFILSEFRPKRWTPCWRKKNVGSFLLDPLADAKSCEAERHEFRASVLRMMTMAGSIGAFDAREA